MAYQDKKGRTRYTLKEKINYHSQRSKPGAVNSRGEALSDFKRGEHLGKAKAMGDSVSYYKYTQKNAAKPKNAKVSSPVGFLRMQFAKKK